MSVDSMSCMSEVLSNCVLMITEEPYQGCQCLSPSKKQEPPQEIHRKMAMSSFGSWMILIVVCVRNYFSSQMITTLRCYPTESTPTEVSQTCLLAQINMKSLPLWLAVYKMLHPCLFICSTHHPCSAVFINHTSQYNWI